jgi:hypothetical protein
VRTYNARFEGGPADGEHRVLENAYPTYTVLTWTNLPLVSYATLLDCYTDTSIRQVHYQRDGYDADGTLVYRLPLSRRETLARALKEARVKP